jgi:hypothetical protein
MQIECHVFAVTPSRDDWTKKRTVLHFRHVHTSTFAVGVSLISELILLYYT